MVARRSRIGSRSAIGGEEEMRFARKRANSPKARIPDACNAI